MISELVLAYDAYWDFCYFPPLGQELCKKTWRSWPKLLGKMLVALL
jgi:hypothetical protein